jgi:hypothetical protein
MNHLYRFYETVAAWRWPLVQYGFTSLLVGFIAITAANLWGPVYLLMMAPIVIMMVNLSVKITDRAVRLQLYQPLYEIEVEGMNAVSDRTDESPVFTVDHGGPVEKARRMRDALKMRKFPHIVMNDPRNHSVIIRITHRDDLVWFKLMI